MIHDEDGQSYENEVAHSGEIPVTSPVGASTEPAGKSKPLQLTIHPKTEEAPPGAPGVQEPGTSKTLYIIRHGSTDMNNDTNTSADRIRGWSDVPLNDEGRQDAEKAGQKLSGMEPPTVMHHSDLDRAAETAQILQKHVDVESTASRKLRPWDLGILTGKSTKEAIPEIKKYVEETPDKPVPKGESFNEFKERAFQGIHDALNSGESPVAIVTHHRLERLLEAWNAKGQPADHSIDLKTFTQKGDPPGGIKTMKIGANSALPEKYPEDAILDYLEEQRQRDWDVYGPEAGPSFVFGRKGVMPKVDTSNLPVSKNIVHSSVGEENPVVPMIGKLSRDLGGKAMEEEFSRAQLRDQFREYVKNRSRIIPTAERMSPMREGYRPGHVEGEGGGGGFSIDEQGNLSREITNPLKASKAGVKPGTPSPLKGSVKWNESDLKTLKDMRASGATIGQIADKLGVTRGKVSGMLNRQSVPSPREVGRPVGSKTNYKAGYL